MPPTTPKFSWKDRDTAAHDLLQLAYHPYDHVRERALNLIAIIGSSKAIVAELEAIALDEGFPILERRYAVKAIAAAPGDLYLPKFGRYAALNWNAWTFQLSFADVARFSFHHPSNHEWLFWDYENQDASTYLSALKITVSHHTKEKWHPIFVQRLTDFFEQNPALLDLEFIQLLYKHGSSVAKDWLTRNLDRVIYICLINKVDAWIQLLQDWPELKRTLLTNCPSIESEIRREIRWQEAHHQLDIERGIYYLQFPTWQKLYTLYLGAKDSKEALSRFSFEAMTNTHIPIRAACAFFLGYLQERYPEATDTLCKLVNLPDYWHSSGPVQREAILALRNTPTPQVWEALMDGCFQSTLTRLDETFSATICYVTDVLESNHKPSVSSGDTELIIPYSRLDSPWFHQLSKISLTRIGRT